MVRSNPAGLSPGAWGPGDGDPPGGFGAGGQPGGASGSGLLRGYVVQVLDGTGGSPQFPTEGNGGKIGDYVDTAWSDDRGAYGVYVMLYGQEDGPGGNLPIGPVPVLSWLRSPPEAPPDLFGNVPSVLSGLASKASAMIQSLIPGFLKPTQRVWGSRFQPRVGSEVLVAHVDGDPRRPVVIAGLYTPDVSVRFPPDATQQAIVPGDDKPLMETAGGTPAAKSLTATGRAISFLDTSLRRNDGDRSWSRNLILFDDETTGDGPAQVFSTEGTFVVDIRGYLDLEKQTYVRSDLHMTVGATEEDVTQGSRCTTVIGDSSSHSLGTWDLTVTGIDTLFHLEGDSEVYLSTRKSTEWALAARFVKPTDVDCVVGKITAMWLLSIQKPTKTQDHDHSGGTFMKLLLMDYKQLTDSKTDEGDTVLGLEATAKTTSPKGTMEKTTEIVLAMKRTLKQDSTTRKGAVEVIIADTITEKTSSKIEL